MQQRVQQCQLLTISTVWPDQDGLHAQYPCRTVATIAYSACTVATISHQDAGNFGMAARQRMLLVWSAAHHVCAAAAVGVHWLTPRCSLAGQKQWNLWAQNSGKSVSASAPSQTACSPWRGHQTLCHSRAVPKRQSLRQENPTLSVFASATLRTATARWRGHPAPRGSSRKVHNRMETCKQIQRGSWRISGIMGNKDDLKDAIGQRKVATVSATVQTFDNLCGLA